VLCLPTNAPTAHMRSKVEGRGSRMWGFFSNRWGNPLFVFVLDASARVRDLAQSTAIISPPLWVYLLTLCRETPKKKRPTLPA